MLPEQPYRESVFILGLLCSSRKNGTRSHNTVATAALPFHTENSAVIGQTSCLVLKDVEWKVVHSLPRNISSALFACRKKSISEDLLFHKIINNEMMSLPI